LFKAGKASKIIATGDYAKDTTLPLLKEFGVGEDAVSFLDARTTEEEARGLWEMFGRSGGVEELGVVDLRGVEWIREPDAGQSDALNKGFAKARGEWLFWLNADDVLLPGALKSLEFRVQSLEFKDVEWVVGDTVYFDHEGIVKGVRTDAKWRPWFGNKLNVWTGGPSAFFKRSLWERLGGFDTTLKYVMDIDLWTRWAQSGVKFASLGKYVWGFREHNKSLTGSGANRLAQLAEWAQVDAKYGVSSRGFWRNITRAASILDGSWLKRKMDSARFRGKLWSEIY